MATRVSAQRCEGCQSVSTGRPAYSVDDGGIRGIGTGGRSSGCYPSARRDYVGEVGTMDSRLLR